VLRSSIRVLTAGIPEGSSQMHPGLAEAVTIILGGLGIVGIIAAAAAVATTAGSASFPWEASTAPVMRAVSPGNGSPADSPPTSRASTRYAMPLVGSAIKMSELTVLRA